MLELDPFLQVPDEAATEADLDRCILVWSDLALGKRTWLGLGPDYRDSLKRIYGEPRMSSKNIWISGRTADNPMVPDEGMISTDDFRVWDKNIYLFPAINNGETRVRALSAGIIVGKNGNVLLPDALYSPKETWRRDRYYQSLTGKNPNRAVDFTDSSKPDSLDIVMEYHRGVNISNLESSPLGTDLKGTTTALDFSNRLVAFNYLRILQEHVAELTREANYANIETMFSGATLNGKLVGDHHQVVDVETGRIHSIIDEKLDGLEVDYIYDPDWSDTSSRPIVLRFNTAQGIRYYYLVGGRVRMA